VETLSRQAERKSSSLLLLLGGRESLIRLFRSFAGTANAGDRFARFSATMRPRLKKWRDKRELSRDRERLSCSRVAEAMARTRGTRSFRIDAID